MKSRLLKLCSIILCTVLLINMLPMQALGAELKESAHGENSQPVLYYQNQMGEPGEAEIVAENIEGRTQFSKEFVMSNGLNMAVIYPETVHYDDNGQWKEIDNTLKPVGSGANARLTNTAGEWTVSFPQQLSSSNQITVNRRGYTLRFGLAGELRSGSQPGLEVMSADSVQKLEIKQANLSQATIQSLDLTAMQESMAYPETFTGKLFSRLQYSNVFDNTHLIYDLNSTAVKESIVLASYDPNVYWVSLYSANRLHDPSAG